MSDTISVTVLNDMQVLLSPHIVAADQDHNSAAFRIISQPASLDALACRAEVQNANGVKTYRLVVDGEFALTNDIAVEGTGYLQLVYGDGVVTTRKTNVVPFHVVPSINAIDPSDPDFSDGLAQIQTAAFASVHSPAPGPNPVATFYNLAGQAVGILQFPPTQSGGLDEAAANLLYVRLNGGNTMIGDLRMISQQGLDAEIGIYLGGRQGGVFWSNSALALRRGAAGEPVLVENFNGTGRSEVVTRELGAQLYLTQATGDARYLTIDLGDIRYLQKDGGQMTGPFISQNGSSNTNLGVSIGENSTGFWRSSQYLICSVAGGTMWQVGGPSATPSVIMGVPLNMATQQITNLGAPPDGGLGNGNAMPRSYADGRYLQPAVGGIVTGPLQIMNNPVVPNDAANKGYVDNAINLLPPVRVPAPVILRDVGSNIAVPASGTWVALTTPITFVNPRGDSTVVCVCCMINATTANVATANVRMTAGGNTLAERRGFVYGSQGAAGFTVMFFRTLVGPAAGPFNMEIQSVGGDGAGPASDFTVVGGIADGPRSQIAVYEVGPPA